MELNTSSSQLYPYNLIKNRTICILTSSKAHVESNKGLIFPSWNNWNTLLTVCLTCSAPSCWYIKWRKLNPARLLFSSNNFNGDTLSTCHHYTQQLYQPSNLIKLKKGTYASSGTKESFGLASNHVRSAVKDVPSHGFK